CSQDGTTVACDFGTWEAGYRETFELRFVASAAYFDAGAPDLRQPEASIVGRAQNPLLSPRLTLDNYRRASGSPDVWPVLRTTIGYTLFSTLGSIVLGLAAAMLLNSKFQGQGLMRGLFLFPYVAPVIAVAFVWAFFLDPFSGTVNALGLRYDLWQEPINVMG